nr:MAG TPA: lipoprotein [Caudoviricetes sp.]
MKLKKTCIAIAVAVGVISLSGCSTASALSGLLSDSPDVTAQVGAENTKQLAGVTAKAEDKREVKVSDSNIGKIDSSVKKSVEVSTIQANTVNAESITVTKPGNWYDAIVGWTLVFIGLLMVYFSIRKYEKKEA